MRKSYVGDWSSNVSATVLVRIAIIHSVAGRVEPIATAVLQSKRRWSNRFVGLFQVGDRSCSLRGKGTYIPIVVGGSSCRSKSRFDVIRVAPKIHVEQGLRVK